MNHVKDNILPAYPGISIQCHGETTRNSESVVEFRYCGSEAELLAAGIVTADMIAIGRQRGGRRDSDGDHFWLDRYWRCTHGQAVRCLRLRFHKRPQFLNHLPGATAALELRRAAETREAANEVVRTWERSGAPVASSSLH